MHFIKDPTVVVSSSPIVAHGWRNWRPRLPMAHIYAVVAVIFVLAVISFLLWREQAARRHIDQTKVMGLFQRHDCSPGALQAVAQEQATIRNIPASVLLLNYRGSCLVKAAQYSQANVIFEQLKVYYNKEHDAAALYSVNEQITANNAAISDKSAPSAARTVK